MPRESERLVAALRAPVSRARVIVCAPSVEQSSALALRLAGLADIEDTARRLVALRTLGVTEGGQRLAITHGALSRWAKRRGLRT